MKLALPIIGALLIGGIAYHDFGKPTGAEATAPADRIVITGFKVSSRDYDGYKEVCTIKGRFRNASSHTLTNVALNFEFDHKGAFKGSDETLADVRDLPPNASSTFDMMPPCSEVGDHFTATAREAGIGGSTIGVDVALANADEAAPTHHRHHHHQA